WEDNMNAVQIREFVEDIAGREISVSVFLKIAHRDFEKVKGFHEVESQIELSDTMCHGSITSEVGVLLWEILVLPCNCHRPWVDWKPVCLRDLKTSIETV